MEEPPMLSRIRTLSRRKIVASLVAPLLLGSVPAGPVGAAEVDAAVADRVYYKDTFYSNATYSVVVGWAYGYCDGDYIVHSGYPTSYVRTKFIAPCP
jgi:hypothetical protein